MTKLDLKNDFKQIYTASSTVPTLVEVPKLSYLMLNGRGDPNSSEEYKEAVESLYSLAYTLKFRLKKLGETPDYSISPLEGLWWVDTVTEFSYQDKSNWHWTMLLRQPDFITPLIMEQARDIALKKKGLPALGRIQLESFEENWAVQIMHLGSYADEPPTIAKLHAYMHAQGYQFNGKHHEIYLNDPNKTRAENLKTIIRQPVKI